MKTIISIIAICISTVAFAKDISIVGAEARNIMETLASANFAVKNIEKEWAGQDLTMVTGPIACRYNSVSFPDEWMSSVECTRPATQSQKQEEGVGDTVLLKNALSIAQNLAPYLSFKTGAGNRWFEVENIYCAMVYDTHAYGCVIRIAEEVQR